MFSTTEIFHPLPGLNEQEFPDLFNCPFNYRPHPWVEAASKELKAYLARQSNFEYNYGHDDQSVGKMFGVLVVENQQKKKGYLAGFSGKINDSNQLPGFVPPVFDVLAPDGKFRQGEKILNSINSQIEELETSIIYLDLLKRYRKLKQKSSSDLQQLKFQHKKAKEERRLKRTDIINLDANEQESQLTELENQSKRHHFEWKDRKRKWKKLLESLQKEVDQFEVKIEKLKSERKYISGDLQHVLHESFQFFNGKGEIKPLTEIFKPYGKIPPAGTGECAAPRLLQYAFKHRLKPLALGEFWFGKPPAGQLRTHGNFYAACKSKCEPILNFMLEGIPVAANPAEKNPGSFEPEILFEDEYLLAVNKPHGILSVPGRKIKDCLQLRLQQLTGNDKIQMVHRLDMATSGIIVAAKSPKIYTLLQYQFSERSVQKVYTAILTAEIIQNNSKIRLPMRVDFDHRPMQMVDYEFGKDAVTYVQKLSSGNGESRVLFYPLTGRTHQLRIHAAHTKGLNAPIKGDDLYGKKSDRLYLHASKLEFRHPVNGEIISLKSPPPF